MEDTKLKVSDAGQTAEEEEVTEIREEASAGGNFNDNLHGENLTDRAKVLSPWMTVVKRFFRSKLSVVGLATIVFLFLFSFVGPLLSPWSANNGTVIIEFSPKGYEIHTERN